MMLSLKIARMNTNEFQTLVPYIDRRHQISYGRAKRKQ